MGILCSPQEDFRPDWVAVVWTVVAGWGTVGTRAAESPQHWDVCLRISIQTAL